MLLKKYTRIKEDFKGPRKGNSSGKDSTMSRGVKKVIKGMQDMLELQDGMIKKLFKKFDKSRNGGITFSDFSNLL